VADEPGLEKIIHSADALVFVSIFDNRVAPSRMCAPDLYEIAREFQGSVIVVRLDANLCPNAAIEHRCGAGPYFMVLRHGNVVQEHFGAAPSGEMERWISSFIPQPERAMPDIGEAVLI